MIRTFAVAALLFGALAFVVSGVSWAAKSHADEAVEHIEEAISHGKQGHADVLVKHAETALMHAEAFFLQAADGIRDVAVTGVQTCALPIWPADRGGRAELRRARGDDAEGGRPVRLSARSFLADVGISLWLDVVPGDSNGNHCRGGSRLDRKSVV